MNRPRYADNRPLDVKFDDASSEMADDTFQAPAWNRERLIRQFQGIDGSSRNEAEMQIDAFERSFCDVSPASLRKREEPDDSTD